MQHVSGDTTDALDGDQGSGFPDIVGDLVEEFRADAPFKKPEYKEDWVRTDFIEPMLEALGWPHLRQSQVTTGSTGFVREVPIDAVGVATVPDYAVYLDGRRVLYIEAKKPSVNIQTEEKPAFQIREYGWNAKDPIGVLTDFEELAFYNCRLEPEAGKPASDGRVAYVTFDEYEQRWDWLVSVLSPEAVAGGSLERLADEFKSSKRLIPVDRALLSEIQGWRLQLARELITNHGELTTRELNYCVQATIDRCLFLRIAEARGLEPHGQLASVLSSETGVYEALLSLFRAADVRYNSGLFHFEREPDRDAPDTLTPGLDHRGRAADGDREQAHVGGEPLSLQHLARGHPRPDVRAASRHGRDRREGQGGSAEEA